MASIIGKNGKKQEKEILIQNIREICSRIVVCNSEKFNFCNYPNLMLYSWESYQINPSTMSEAQKQPLSPKEQIREEVEAREPSYQEYIKSHGYTEMMVNDPEAQMAYKVISKSEPLQPDSYGDIRYYLMDVTLKIQDPEGVRQVIAQDIQIIFSGERKGKSG